MNGIVTGDVAGLYDHFLLVLEEVDTKKERNEIYDSVRWGVRVKFDIHDYIQGSRIVDKLNCYIVRTPRTHRRVKVSIEDFRSEVEDRKCVMRKLIYDNIGFGESIEPFDDESDTV